MRIDANDLLIIGGAALIVTGISLLSVAAGLIAAGVFLALLGAVRDLLHGHH